MNDLIYFVRYKITIFLLNMIISCLITREHYVRHVNANAHVTARVLILDERSHVRGNR